jgi:hypothetical protein
MSIDLQLPQYLPTMPTQSIGVDYSAASSVASSCSSVFSADSALSQVSESSSTSTHFYSDFDSVQFTDSKLSACERARSLLCPRTAVAPLTTDSQIQSHQYDGPQHRQHPRRSLTAGCQRPPPLVRQCERKVNFVDSLVDSATQLVEVIWPLSVPSCREGSSGGGALSLRTFIQETLRRSRSSYSTLQVALYYLVLIKSKVPKHDFTMEQPEDTQSLRALQCGRRMFLAALILASKYLQDRNYSAKAWSKISGLQTCEISINELAFLEAVDWRVHLVNSTFERWRAIVLHYTPSQQPPSPGSNSGLHVRDWKSVIPDLTPELDRVPLPPQPPPAHRPAEPKLLRTPPVSLPDRASRDSTPTPQNLPRYLEPRTDVIPPTPAMPRMAPLPTPQMTPRSVAPCTPAASALTAATGRSAMCVAMTQAHNASVARATLDSWNLSARPHGMDHSSRCHVSGRRPSIVTSVSSLSSSPESMISDNSSRSSRASSISSVSSAHWLSQTKLARLATCRNVKLPYPGYAYYPKEASLVEDHHLNVARSSPSPELQRLVLSDGEFMTQVPLPVHDKLASPTNNCDEIILERSSSRTRKRGRSSVDFGLQKHVRDLLQASPSIGQPHLMTSYSTSHHTASDEFDAGSLTPLDTCHRIRHSYDMSKALQSSSKLIGDRLPVQKDLGRKRACCVGDVELKLRRSGPGMWEGVL